MSAFTFDFDLDDDLDESFDAIPPTTAPIDTAIVPEGLSEAELPAEEIPLSDLVRTPSPSPLTPLVLTTASRSAAFRAPRSPLILAVRAVHQWPHARAAGPLRRALPAAGAGTRRADRPSRRAGGPRPRRVRGRAQDVGVRARPRRVPRPRRPWRPGRAARARAACARGECLAQPNRRYRHFIFVGCLGV